MSQQEVRLHILPKGHTGPVFHATTPTGVIAGPHLRPALHRDGVGMIYRQGTLYTDTPPDLWSAVDHDRAAALGYGPREAWPEFPTGPVKPGPVDRYLNGTTNPVPLSILRLRENKLAELYAMLSVDFHLVLRRDGLHAFSLASPKTTKMHYIAFDSLPATTIAAEIRHRLK